MNDDERAAKLAAAAEELVTALRRIGLYEGVGETVRHIPGDRLVVILDLVVGDIAFMPRVQDPEQDDFDRTFGALEASFHQQEANEIADRIRRGDWEDDD